MASGDGSTGGHRRSLGPDRVRVAEPGHGHLDSRSDGDSRTRARRVRKRCGRVGRSSGRGTRTEPGRVWGQESRKFQRPRPARRVVANPGSGFGRRAEGSDSNKLVAEIESRCAESAIPPASNRREPRESDAHTDKARNVCGRFRSRLRQYRRIASRYEKRAKSFWAVAHLKTILVLLK